MHFFLLKISFALSAGSVEYTDYREVRPHPAAKDPVYESKQIVRLQ